MNNKQNITKLKNNVIFISKLKNIVIYQQNKQHFYLSITQSQ